MSTKQLFNIFTLLLFSFGLQAQFGNNGALISVKSGATLSIHEEVVNYNGGEFHNTDTIYAFYDWTNNAGNEAFISNGVGIVHLYGNDQRIKGTDITRFYDLRLEQTGVKYGDLDVYVDGFLRLNDRQFHLDTNCVSVFNSDPISVENVGNGYVSALEKGGLLRHLENTQAYFYPVGWPNYYRPLELSMESNALNIMKVRMAFEDATNDNFDRALKEPSLCDVNSVYYHRIYQEAGTNGAKIKLHYDAAVDGDWNTIAHFQNVPQWEDTGDETSGIDPVSGLDYFESVDFINDFTYPAFALGDAADTIPLVADDTIICLGQTVTFTVETGFSFYEFFINDISVQAGTSNTYVSSTLQDGDIVSFGSSVEGCIFQGSSIIMTVNPLPVAMASSNSPVCENSDLELSANGGTSYQWEGPNSFTSSEQNPIVPDVSTLAASTYTVTVTDINECSDITSIEVVIFPEPVISISSNSPICDGDDLNLMSDGGISYEWEGPNSFTAAEQNPTISSADLNANGTYTVTVTDANLCTLSATVDVIINMLPEATASNNSPVCLGETIILNATGGTDYVWEGPDNFASSEQNPTILISTLAGNGTYTVTVTDANGCASTATTNVIVNDLPLVNASSNSPVCDGNELLLTANGGTDYVWEGPDSFSSSEQNPSINPVSLATAGTYTVTVTDANGCVSTTSTNAIINELPIVTISSNSPVCAESTILLFADGGLSYEWSGPNSFSSSEQNPSIENASVANAGIYTVEITDGNACINTSTSEVLINELPDAMASSNSPVCLGETIILNASGGTDYVWEGPNSFASNEQNPIIPISTLAGNGTYTVTVTDANACVSTATTDVIVNDLPIVDASSNSPVCDGNELILTANGGTDYIWEGPNSFTSSEQNPIINPVSLLTAGTYSVTVTDANGCVSTTSTDVIINELPIVTISSNSPVCAESTILLFADGGLSYEWSGPNSFSSSEQNPSIENASAANAGIYTVTITDGNACMNTNTSEIFINELPTANASNNGPVCVGFDIQLNSSGGVEYEWSSTTGFTSNEQNPLLENVDVNTSGTYTVTVTDANACTSSTSTTVNIFDPVNETVSNTSPVCQGENINFFASGDASWSYEWSGPNGFSSSEQNPTLDNSQLSDSGTYSVTITDGNACTEIYNTIGLVSDFPKIDSFSSGPECEGKDIQLETTFDGNWEYLWTGPSGFMDTIHNPLLENVTVDNEGDYIVTAINATGCETSDTVSIEIYEGVYAESYGDTAIFINESTIIGILGEENYTYEWNPTTGLNCSNCPEMVAAPLETTIYEIIVTNEFGCLDTFDILVQVNDRTDEDLVVPNTITPNGDGYNDTWEIPWLVRFPDNQVVILNRWGDEVYSAKPYENDFDGRYEGRDLPAGTYYFILLLGEDFSPFKGPLTIIRK